MKKLLENIITLSCILLLLWFAVSTVEVWIKHHKPNPQYSSTNMWGMLIDFGTEYHNAKGGIN